jgi:hypothetical protein
VLILSTFYKQLQLFHAKVVWANINLLLFYIGSFWQKEMPRKLQVKSIRMFFETAFSQKMQK